MDQQYWKFLNDEWNAGRLTRPGVALANFRANPRGFLEKHPIQAAYDPAINCVAQVYLTNGTSGERPGSILKTVNMHKTETYKIQPLPGQSGDGHPFWVHGLSTGQSSVAPAWQRLDATGPDIMLTAKLTGCTFVARPVAGQPNDVEVVHMQPHQETGVQLNQRMVIAGQQAYGRLKYDIDVRSINVIGIRRAGAWKIYAQKIEKHHLTVRSVTRIYPA